MKKSTLIGNLVAAIVLAAVSTAFLAWYHLSDASTVLSAITTIPAAQIGVVLAAPVLLYAIGIILGLVVVWFKKITFGRGARLAFRLVSAAVIALFLLAIIPVFAPDAASALMGPVVVVFYVSRLAPVFIVLLGFLYAMGCVPVNKDKRGPFAKYLPDDHFE